jgi:hypothetical protein
MHVCVSIRIPVVMPVMPHPPEGAILAGKNTEESENELEQPAGLERAVCEQSLIACGDPEDLKRAGDQECRHRWAAQADKKNQSAAQMQQDKGCEECNVPRREQTHLIGLGLHLIDQRAHAPKLTLWPGYARANLNRNASSDRSHGGQDRKSGPANGDPQPAGSAQRHGPDLADALVEAFLRSIRPGGERCRAVRGRGCACAGWDLNGARCKVATAHFTISISQDGGVLPRGPLTDAPGDNR